MSDSHAWPSGNAGRKQKSRLLARFRSFVDTECTVRTKGGGYEVNVNRRLSLNEAIVQDILGDVEGADKQEDPHIYLPYLPKWAPGSGALARGGHPVVVPVLLPPCRRGAGAQGTVLVSCVHQGELHRSSRAARRRLQRHRVPPR